MKWNYLFLVFLLTSVISQSAHTQMAGTDIGWLLFPVGGRPSGMGTAFFAEASGIEAMMWNPAGFAYLGKKAFMFSHMDNIEDSAVEYLAFGIPSSAWGNFGLSMTLVHFGEPIHKTGRSGEDLGLISAWHSITSLSYATNIIPSLRFGANFKFLLSSLAGVKGYTEVADIGLQYDLLDDFCIGLGVKNWGPDIQYIDKYQSDPPATRLVLGLRYQLLGDEVNNLFFVYDVYKSLINLDASFDEQKKEMKNYLGAEYTYMNMLSFRYGYKFEKYTATSGSTYGMGVHFKNFQIDFAQIEGSDLGNKQIFSIISNF